MTHVVRFYSEKEDQRTIYITQLRTEKNKERHAERKECIINE